MWIDCFDCVFFFFFQAEDGIRDLTVTGVQTCALPICGQERNVRADERAWRKATALTGALVVQEKISPLFLAHHSAEAAPENVLLHGEIGRASCRERV